MAASASDKLQKSYSFLQKSIGATISDVATSLTLNNYTNIPTDTKVQFIIDRIDSNGNRTNSTREIVSGTCTGSAITNLSRGLHGTTAQSHDAGAVVEFTMTGSMWNDMVDWGLVEHNQDGTHTDTVMPTGAILDYAGTSAPSGWLMCYGQAISRTTYADLFTAISTTYGVGDGSTTFNLPDLRGRVVAGKDDMGGSSANRLTDAVSQGVDGDVLGDTGGEETHTQTEAELATHTHIQDSHNHTERVATTTTSGTGITGTANLSGNINSNQSTAGTTATNQNTGSSTAFNVLQPTIILNKIIKY